ncbi:hypothetical protein Pelo_8239 [Pelomyxa schiedti]|nr:hypothetical protein Pelo_8239 [Pelomyxa schiedti]
MAMSEADWVGQLSAASGCPSTNLQSLGQYVQQVGKSTALYQLGLVFEQRGMTDRAAQCFLQADSPVSLTALGVLYENKGDVMRAMQTFKMAATLSANLHLASLHYSCGDFKQAEQILLKCNSPSAWLLLGTFYAREGLHQKASEAFNNSHLQHAIDWWSANSSPSNTDTAAKEYLDVLAVHAREMASRELSPPETRNKSDASTSPTDSVNCGETSSSVTPEDIQTALHQADSPFTTMDRRMHLFKTLHAMHISSKEDVIALRGKCLIMLHALQYNCRMQRYAKEFIESLQSTASEQEIAECIRLVQCATAVHYSIGDDIASCKPRSYEVILIFSLPGSSVQYVEVEFSTIWGILEDKDHTRGSSLKVSIGNVTYFVLGENLNIPLLNRFRPAGKVHAHGEVLTIMHIAIQKLLNTTLSVDMFLSLVWALVGGIHVTGELPKEFFERGIPHSPPQCMPVRRNMPVLVQQMGVQFLVSVIKSVVHLSIPQPESTTSTTPNAGNLQTPCPNSEVASDTGQQVPTNPTQIAVNSTTDNITTAQTTTTDTHTTTESGSTGININSDGITASTPGTSSLPQQPLNPAPSSSPPTQSTPITPNNSNSNNIITTDTTSTNTTNLPVTLAPDYILFSGATPPSFFVMQPDL